MQQQDPIRFRTKEEFQERPNYRRTLNCEIAELSHLVGDYAFSSKKQMQCGLNGCRVWHANGYVYAKKTGEEGHCGIICGRSMFGFEFREFEASYRLREKEKTERELLEDFKSNVDDILTRAAGLEAGVSASVQRVKHFIEHFIKPIPEIEREFFSALRNSGKIQAVDFAGQARRQALGRQSRGLELLTVAYIRGGAAVANADGAEGRLRRKLYPIRQLATMEIETLSKKERAEFIGKMQDAREAMQAAGLFVRDARRLTSCAGIAEITKLRQVFPADQGGRVAAGLAALELVAQDGLPKEVPTIPDLQ